MRETDPSHEILPSRIRPQVVKHRKRQLDDSEDPLLISLLQQLECGCQVTESGVNDGNIKWGDVLLVGQRLQFLEDTFRDRKSTRLNSSHSQISYAVFCLKKKKHSDP